MKCKAGFLKVLCIWMVIQMQSLDARHGPRKHAAAVSCRLKELTALTKSLVGASLKSFDEANGKHLGTWPSGFPELQVQQDSPLHGPKCQCSLLFMAQGLEKVLEDQRSNLNPDELSLHKALRETITRVDMLTECAKEILGGECPQKPPPPKMPRHVFERKQWSHTLLKTAREYLDWMERKVSVKVRNEMRRAGAALLRYLEGSRYVL